MCKIYTRAMVTGSILLLSSMLACSPQPGSEPLPVNQLSVAADCDVLGACRVGDSTAYIDIVFATTPRALQPFPVVIKPEGMMDIKSVSVSFIMRDMVMGTNRYTLIRTPTGEWQGEVTLPICVSGRTDWVAEFDLHLPDRHVLFTVPFVLAK